MVKKKINIKKKIEKKYKYSVVKALSIIKKMSRAHFDESLDIALRINNKKYNKIIQESIKLPYKTGKKYCILAFVEQEKEQNVLNYGAHYVGKNYIEKIKSGWWDKKINIVICTPSIINSLNDINKFLGAKRLIPNLYLQTISENPEIIIKNIKSGTIFIKSDKNGIIHSSVGRISFSEKMLTDNIVIFIKEIINKHNFLQNDIKTIYLSTTMSKSIELDTKFFIKNKI